MGTLKRQAAAQSQQMCESKGQLSRALADAAELAAKKEEQASKLSAISVKYAQKEVETLRQLSVVEKERDELANKMKEATLELEREELKWKLKEANDRQAETVRVTKDKKIDTLSQQAIIRTQQICELAGQLWTEMADKAKLAAEKEELALKLKEINAKHHVEEEKTLVQQSSADQSSIALMEETEHAATLKSTAAGLDFAKGLPEDSQLKLLNASLIKITHGRDIPHPENSKAKEVAFKANNSSNKVHNLKCMSSTNSDKETLVTKLEEYFKWKEMQLSSNTAQGALNEAGQQDSDRLRGIEDFEAHMSESLDQFRKKFYLMTKRHGNKKCPQEQTS